MHSHKKCKDTSSSLYLLSPRFSYVLCLLNFRSSLLEVFCKKVILRNFAKFTGKRLCQSFFFNKVAGLRAATLLKKDSATGVFL